MGRQLIYPLYTFQVTGFSLQDDGNGATVREREREKEGKTRLHVSFTTATVRRDVFWHMMIT